MSKTKSSLPNPNPTPASVVDPLIRRYGWIPEKPDYRDIKYTVGDWRAAWMRIQNAPIVDMRPQDSPLYDQAALGSCTGNAIAGISQFVRRVEKLDDWTPSRLAIYYGEREIEGTINQDSGAEIRDGFKVIGDGICSESLWPYDISKFAVEPSPDAEAEEKKHPAITYSRLDNTQLLQLLDCLAAGYPFVLGFTVYESFESEATAETGIVTMPAADETILGGHAVMAVGYDLVKKIFIVRNSWGDSWGDKGYFYMPFDYVTSPDLADDFWTLRVQN